MASQPDHPVGPFPAAISTSDDRIDYDKLRRRVLWTMPSGLYVLGSHRGDSEYNLMTLNWASQVSSDPKLVGVGVEKTAYTHELIEATGAFSLNILSRESRPIVRKFVKPVEVDVDAATLNGFAFHTRATGSPVLDEAVAYVDMTLWKTVDCGAHAWFIGEVVDAGFLRDESIEILRTEDTRMSYGG